MRQCSLPVFPFAAGLAIAVSSSALADPAVSSTPTRAGAPNDPRVQRDPTDAPPSPRDGVSFNGEIVTMIDALEHFPLGVFSAAAPVSGEPDTVKGPVGFEWGLNTLTGQGAQDLDWVSVVDLMNEPVGLFNTSRAVRLRTAIARNPGDFYMGVRHSWPVVMRGDAEIPARVQSDLFVTSLAQLYSFEAVDTIAGFISTRVMWGGDCAALDLREVDCATVAPQGLLNAFIFLSDCLPGRCFLPEFWPGRFCASRAGVIDPECTPPPFANAGDVAQPQIGAWFRLAYEIGADGRRFHFVDYLDGTGEHAFGIDDWLFAGRIDRLDINTSFENADALLYLDNIVASGPVFDLPKPPPLDCPYLDDMEWMNTGLVQGQNQRWDAPLASLTTIINDGARGQVISQINSDSSDNQYRREIATELPPAAATLANDLVATVQVRTTGGTVRGFALFNDGELAARVYLGREDPNDPVHPFYEPSIYAQINPSYDPIDLDEIEPYDNVPVVGVDVADTKVDWTTGSYRTLEIRLSANGVLRVSIDGQRIYTGAGAFSTSIDTFAFESENNAFGAGASLRINDVTLTCDAPPCAADFSLDDVIDFADLNAVLSNFGASGLPAGVLNAGDANADGVVDFTDLNAVLSAFGTTCD